ncbi:MAG TPA: phenylalanine--tRNA ligase beta subunit-related protein [Paludibacteraceae bacterium]|nr:phenylalanine--tRNA ligase beta subunit-related protein [Paludibacteraceae bacterium]HON01808.1 phenylalanine--tRNA ligase beta subunit-related protein [Paludibacteraceae bacterium]HPD58483.1 phenylalanine--tRNA ligase beta subunit-related protein [Paludibacteraceae bacterium]
MQIYISELIRQACPDLTLSVIACEVKNSETTSILWQEIEEEMEKISSTFTLENIKMRPEISATRQVYRKLGKDPNRYRPSAEALCRRICKGVGIQRVSTLVDIINLISIRSGFSIGGFDAKKIQGDLRLEVGTANDIFQAIGRGILNVEGLPLFKDAAGGIGTPTSDNERTKLTMETRRLLMIINGYSGEKGLQEASEQARMLLEKYAEAKEVNITLVK